VALATGDIVIKEADSTGAGIAQAPRPLHHGDRRVRDGALCRERIGGQSAGRLAARPPATQRRGKHLADRPQSGASSRIVDKLAWPAGLSVDDTAVVYSESWKHRLVRVDTANPGPGQVLYADLPGYPGRIAPSGDGHWLAVFAPRTQLVEFVLREPVLQAHGGGGVRSLLDCAEAPLRPELLRALCRAAA
jgi:hypothetical protein